MENKRFILLAIVLLLLGAGLVVLLNQPQKKEKEVQTNISKVEFQTSDWRKNYALDNKKPQGLYVFKSLLETSEKVKTFNEYTDYKLLDSLLLLDSSLFMFIGKEFILTDDEMEQLLISIENGNQLFLSLEKMPNYLLLSLSAEFKIHFIPAKTAVYETKNQKYNQYNLFEKDTITGFWEFFADNGESVYEVHSTLQGQPVFISIPYGKGKVFLHLNPNTFVNYQLLREEGKNYFSQIVYLLEQPHLHWFTFAEYELTPTKNGGEFPPHLLAELFKHPAFRLGFIFAVIGIMLYLLFRSKRREPIIPAVINSKNTGFSYVDTLAGIYYDKNHAKKILEIMRSNFFSAVYEHFYIDLSKENTPKSIERLVQKTAVPKEEIKNLMNRLNISTEISSEYLKETYQLQRSFYFRSGIWNSEAKEKVQNKPQPIYYRKENALFFIGGGIIAIIFSFIALSFAFGLGIIFWPVGLVLLFLGIRRLSNPAIILKPESLETFNFFGRKEIIFIENIRFISKNSLLYIIELKDGRIKKINWTNLDKDYLVVLDRLVEHFKRN